MGLRPHQSAPIAIGELATWISQWVEKLAARPIGVARRSGATNASFDTGDINLIADPYMRRAESSMFPSIAESPDKTDSPPNSRRNSAASSILYGMRAWVLADLDIRILDIIAVVGAQARGASITADQRKYVRACR